MHITELLITGYDGEEPVFAVNLVPEDDGNKASKAFAVVRELIEDLPVVSAR